MPSMGVHELLVKQERARIERLSRDAWKQQRVSDVPASGRAKGWRQTFTRPDTTERA